MNKPVNDFAESTDFLKILPDLWRGRKLILICVAAAVVVSAGCPSRRFFRIRLSRKRGSC